MKKLTITILYLVSIFAILMFVYLGKYIPLEYALQKVQYNKYTEDYKCVDFSKDLINELQKVGIQSSMIAGEDEETILDDKVGHAWVGIWIEPQTGEFTTNYLQIIN